MSDRAAFEKWWRERQKATWRPLEGDPETPPEQWGAAFRCDAELAWRAACAACAEACENLASDKWAQYKGRKPYEPMNPNRANPQTQGESDGLSIAAAACRELAK
jgi:hypothetical protein